MGGFDAIEVPGLLVQSYVDAFRLVRHVPHSILAKRGVGRIDAKGDYVLDQGAFYPFDRALAAVKELATTAGPKKMFEAGLEVPKNAAIPPGATDIVSAMRVFDGGYHLNHRRNGRPMFDPATGRMAEGIGHYACASVGDREIVIEVDTPYPCDLDRGIMQAWARRFEPTARCTHLEPSVCRSKGGPRCRYAITW